MQNRFDLKPIYTRIFEKVARLVQGQIDKVVEEYDETPKVSGPGKFQDAATYGIVVPDPRGWVWPERVPWQEPQGSSSRYPRVYPGRRRASVREHQPPFWLNLLTHTQLDRRLPGRRRQGSSRVQRLVGPRHRRQLARCSRQLGHGDQHLPL